MNHGYWIVTTVSVFLVAATTNAAEIKGRVLREGGLPAVNVVVRLCPTRVEAKCTEARTDMEGRYAFRERLRPGVYLLEASDAGRSKQDRFRIKRREQVPIVRDLILDQRVARSFFVTTRIFDKANHKQPTDEFHDSGAVTHGRIVQRIHGDPCLPILSSTEMPMTPEDFHNELREAFRDGKVVIYVHGYNVDFSGATRVATILGAHALKAEGAAIAFSWPSKGSLVGYIADENAAEIAAGHFADFLADFLSRHPSKTVHLVAHSMGSRVVTTALDELSARKETLVRERIGQVVLVAPDIAPQVLRRRMPGVLTAAKRVTVYFSIRDLAVKLASLLSANSKVGENALALARWEDVEVVNASDLETGRTGHSYLCSSLMQKDLYFLLKGTGAKDRGLDIIPISNDTKYFVLK